MRGVRAAITLAGVFLLALVATPVGASGQTVGPGFSEIDQYYESIQFSEGERAVDRGRDPGGSPVPAATLGELQGSGAEGKTTAELARATAPGPGEPGAGGLGGAAGAEEGSALGGILEALTDGPWLPVLLGLILAGGIIYLLNRRRSATGAS